MSKKNVFFAIAFLVVCVVVIIAIQSVESQEDMVKRGKYLVDAVAACGYCHTPRAGSDFDPNMYLAGHPSTEGHPRYNRGMRQQGIFILTSNSMTAFSAPFGTSFASNLTPDKLTGLGEWTEKMFIDAMRTGKHQGNPDNRNIFPPMPYKHYAQMTDADLKAIWAYLRTIKPIENDVSPVLNPLGRPY